MSSLEMVLDALGRIPILVYVLAMAIGIAGGIAAREISRPLDDDEAEGRHQ